MKSGKMPWKCHDRGVPFNPTNQKRYSGINPILLDCVAHERGYDSKYWATFNQWNTNNLMIKSGSKSVEIIKWDNLVEFVEKQESIQLQTYMKMKTYPVFCFSQCTGILDVYETYEFKNLIDNDYTKVDNIVKNRKIKIKTDKTVDFAYHDPINEEIVIPTESFFSNDSQYYATILHELAHHSESLIGWGDRPLHQGELLAEIVTGYVESELGFNHDQDTTNQNLYFETWIQEINNDPDYLFQAATFASKSIDWILDDFTSE